MARPWRRVLIGLSIRTGIDLHALERYDIATIRGYLGMLGEINKPAARSRMDQQTPEEMQAALTAAMTPLRK